MKIKLGDKVRCKITGFTGIVVAKTEFINGCVQYNVAPRWNKTISNPMEQETSIDEKSLEVFNSIPAKKKRTIKRERNGGAMRKISRRNF